jgi:hypothetical protein
VNEKSGGLDGDRLEELDVNENWNGDDVAGLTVRDRYLESAFPLRLAGGVDAKDEFIFVARLIDALGESRRDAAATRFHVEDLDRRIPRDAKGELLNQVARDFDSPERNEFFVEDKAISAASDRRSDHQPAGQQRRPTSKTYSLPKATIAG